MTDDPARFRTEKSAASYGLGNKLARIIWVFAWTVLARWTPPPLWAWRRSLLRLFGAQVGRGAQVHASVRIWLPARLAIGRNALIGPRVTLYNQGRISIGERSVVSQGAHLCASSHNVRDPGFGLVEREIAVGSGCWIAAEAFVGPGVTMGDGAVLGARAVLFEDAEPMTIYRGNPATALKERQWRG
ncbi:putative colanic acid biosynthesis acetyltransferase [Parapontixanthobacter aurantiacus]|uniref:putative colanic acid biosynthesis acetyltransferase n=1 Tax=Parapontixanthobacter aurantiacus TaxID=1463599 RepID=UPI00301C0B5F